jgi:hypothetical protein
METSINAKETLQQKIISSTSLHLSEKALINQDVMILTLK